MRVGIVRIIRSYLPKRDLCQHPKSEIDYYSDAFLSGARYIPEMEHATKSRGKWAGQDDRRWARYCTDCGIVTELIGGHLSEAQEDEYGS